MDMWSQSDSVAVYPYKISEEYAQIIF